MISVRLRSQFIAFDLYLGKVSQTVFYVNVLAMESFTAGFTALLQSQSG